MAAYLSKREQKILYVCISLILAYIAQYWVINPMLRYRKILGGEIQAVQLKVEKNLRLIRKAKRIQDTYGKYLARFERTDSEGEIMSDLIAEVERIANQVSFSIDDLKPQKVYNDGAINYFPISLEFRCNLETLAHFLHRLSSWMYLFQVEELQIDTLPAREGEMLKVYVVIKKSFIGQ